MCVHLHLSEKVFWCSTHRKIVDLLDIDREVNTLPEDKKKNKNVASGKKMTLEEVKKLL